MATSNDKQRIQVPEAGKPLKSGAPSLGEPPMGWMPRATMFSALRAADQHRKAKAANKRKQAPQDLGEPPMGWMPKGQMLSMIRATDRHRKDKQKD